MIVVDSREQKPYWSGRHCMKTALLVGDYTTLELINKFHVERKSLADLYGTITKGHNRFKKEIYRAIHNKIELCVVVEGTKKQFELFPERNGRKITGETVIKIVDKISSRYNLTFHWCVSRQSAKGKTNKLLKTWKKK